MGTLTTISARYQVRVTSYSSPPPGSTIQVAQSNTKRWFLGFFTRIGNDISLTTNPDPATGDFLDVRGGDDLQWWFSKHGPIVQLPWFLGTSSGGAPVMVFEVIDLEG